MEPAALAERYQGTDPSEAVVLAPASTGAVLTLLLIFERGATGDIGSLLQAATSIGTTTAASTGIRTTRATIEAGIKSS